jgi:hypothetical protein
MEEHTYQNWFSVYNRLLNSHVVVCFEGDDKGFGTWNCMKDRQIKCGHIVAASEEFGNLLEVLGQNYDHTLNVDLPSELYEIVV